MIYIYNIKWHNTFIIKMLHTEIAALIKRLGIHGKLTEGCPPRKALFGGIAFHTKVTLGSFLPRVLCVVKLPNNFDDI